MNKYFVCFSCTNGIDNCDILRETEIASMDDIKEIQNSISKIYSLEKVVIYNWQKFEGVKEKTKQKVKLDAKDKTPKIDEAIKLVLDVNKTEDSK